MSSPRPALIADAAIAVIAERGLRGLTHRAVDTAAGLPPGSTSNYARTRASLLEAALDRIADLESAVFRSDGGSPVDPVESTAGEPPRQALAELVAAGLHQALTGGRTLTLARFELALEATRRPELRAGYDRLGAGFTALAAELLTLAGSAAPERQALSLVRWCEGVLFYAVAGAGQVPTPTEGELRADVGRYLEVLLGEG